MNPSDFLEDAWQGVASLRESEWRTAASRAYYAVFHVACRLLRQCGFVVPQADRAHGYLWLRLANSRHPDVQQAGERLKDLRTIRNRADYDLDSPFAQTQAVGATALAQDVIQLLETISTMPHLLTQITDAIRIYERDVLRDVTWQS